MLGLCSSRQGVFGLSQELSKTSLPTLAGRCSGKLSGSLFP